MSWAPATFLSASPGGPVEKFGYEYRGLGLFIAIKESPKGRRPPTWSLTHLNSGHRVCLIAGRVADAFPAATAIAHCGDWDFDGLDGWRNRDPELPRKVQAACKPYGKRITMTSGGGDQNVARQIVTARSA